MNLEQRIQYIVKRHRHRDPEAVAQELRLSAWQHGPRWLDRRSIDLRRAEEGDWRYGRRGRRKRGVLKSMMVFDPEPFEYRGPEPEIALMLIAGWRAGEIAKHFRMHKSMISRRIDRIRNWYRPVGDGKYLQRIPASVVDIL